MPTTVLVIDDSDKMRAQTVGILDQAGLFDQVREAQALRFPPPMEHLTVTVSMGVSAFPAAEVDSIDSLLRQADEALYRAKNMGRNRVETMPVL